jgi:heme-degrading monooxygenase HmoA
MLAAERVDPLEGSRAGVRRSGMHARLTTIEGSPDRMDEATRHVQEQTLSQLRQMDGFKGFVALGDRNSGRLLGVTFWEDEEALRATEQAASGVRGEAAEAVGGSVAGVEEYEVFVYEAPSTGPVSGVTDTVGGVTDTVGGTVSGTTDSARGVTDNLLGGGEKQQR